MDTSFARQHSSAQKPLRHSAFRVCACCQPKALPANPARRNFLAGGLAALGLGVSAVPAAAQAASEKTRIDVHHHYVPPSQGEAMAKHGGQAPKWTVQSSLADMEKAGVTTAVLSLAPPGVWFGDVEEGRSLARACNEYGAQLRKDNPGRFGLFAAIPLPDTEGSLREIAYALDVLKADGMGLFTSYGDKWPGDMAYARVFVELNRRKAVVFIHPAAPSCCSHLMPGIAASTVEFLFDTSRAIISLLVNGTFSNFSGIRFIFCHAGGTMPMVAARTKAFIERHKDIADRIPNGVPSELRKLYYDVANSINPSSMAALMNLVPTSQLLFGSDFPYVPCAVTANGLDHFGLSLSDLQAVNRENATRLFPRLNLTTNPAGTW